jgi:hypothetical protein
MLTLTIHHYINTVHKSDTSKPIKTLETDNHRENFEKMKKKERISTSNILFEVISRFVFVIEHVGK